LGAKVTLKDVAREAGVSLATASYALNGKSEVGEGTRALVAEVARKLGYQANLAARAIKTGRTGSIGLVIPNITNPLFAKLAQSVTSAAEDFGQAVLLVDTEGSKEAERDALRHLVSHGADGLIWFPINDAVTLRPGSLSAPAVVLDRSTPEYDVVQAEYREGGRLIGEHLADQGHVRIGFINGPRDVANSRERSDGVRDAIKGRAEAVWSVDHPYVSKLTDDARACLERRDATAVVCGNDLIALAAMAAMREMGQTPGADVALVGFDDIELCQFVWPTLTSARLPIGEMGAAAVERLNVRIRKPDLLAHRIIFPIALNIRGSSSARFAAPAPPATPEA
jgi:LacI family transcriptional regulator